MEAAPTAAKWARYDTDYQRCIICQTETDQELMVAPSAHTIILQYIRERARYGDGNFPEINRRLGNATPEDLKLKSATWHRKCYQQTVNVTMCKRAKTRYEKQLSAMGVGDPNASTSGQLPSDGGMFTRSQSTPYDKELCFFCDCVGSRGNPLHKVATTSAGQNLRQAVEKSGNDTLKVKLATSINQVDAHAIDIRYHKRCWATHVTNVDRGKKPSESSAADLLGAQIEFLSLVEGTLLEGKLVSMAVLQDVYEDIMSANNVVDPQCNRKKVKKLIESEIPDAEFHKPKRVNEAERVTLKRTRDAAVQLMEETRAISEEDMKTLFSAASILRKAISKAEKWTFAGSFVDVTSEHVPKELYCFFRWVIQGPHTAMSTDTKSSQVNKHALSLAQSTVSMFLSKYQVSNKKSQSLRMMREMPQQLAVGVAIRQAIRSKKIVNLLNGFGMSVGYTRLLQLEGQVVTSVLQRMKANDGVYVPPDVVQGRHIYFAVDNVDFAEDTPDGKRTLHGTAMAIYQRCQSDDEAPRVELSQPALRAAPRDLMSCCTIKLLDCPKPPSKPQSPVYASYSLRKDPPQPSDGSLPDVAWLMGRTLVRSQQWADRQENETVLLPDEQETGTQESTAILTWSAYHSLTASEVLPITRVGTPPLIAAPAHEWSTLLTVLKQAQGISAKVMGPDRKTVITLDLGLYKPAKQLQMARKDMDHLVLRPGELHIVMAQLRCIGAYIENSGIDYCWTEADLYGPVTVKQIIEGKHVRRAIEAHVVTLQSLFQLYQTAFLQDHPDLQRVLTEAAQALVLASVDCSTEGHAGGMLLVSKSRPNINLEETIGRHELSVVPRSMFAADGTMLHCHVKSNLMAILEKLPRSDTDKESGLPDSEEESEDMPAAVKVAVVDAMADVQSLQKLDNITNCSQLADQFTTRILERYSDADEVHLVFDRYDVTSLKGATRDRRHGGQPVIAYHITDATNIAKVPLKRLLSHVKTKMELTGYLAEKILVKAHAEEKQMVVAWGSQCRATHRNVDHLHSQQEEADTKLLLHAAEATASGASIINIHSPDTDVFVLALRRYPLLCTNTNFVTGVGTKRRVIPLGPIYEALGPNKAAALPGLHAFSGADNTGGFAGRGKLAFWKIFRDARDDSNEISALTSLGTMYWPNDAIYDGLEEFLCKVYLPGTKTTKMEKLRWWLFTKKQAESERLPPTQAALQQAILRAHYQAMIWNNDTVPNPEVPSPQDYGWNLEDGVWVPVMTKELPAPNAVIQLVKCGCSKSKCDNARCSCRKAGLGCTELCACDSSEGCDNPEQPTTSLNDEEDEDSGGDEDDVENFI